jgi:hypothetical protein
MGETIQRMIRHYHQNDSITIYTSIDNYKPVVDGCIVKTFGTKLNLYFGEWHPLIWSKLEAFNSSSNELTIFLDVDNKLSSV